MVRFEFGLNLGDFVVVDVLFVVGRRLALGGVVGRRCRRVVGRLFDRHRLAGVHLGVDIDREGGIFLLALRREDAVFLLGVFLQRLSLRGPRLVRVRRFGVPAGVLQGPVGVVAELLSFRAASAGVGACGLREPVGGLPQRRGLGVCPLVNRTNGVVVDEPEGGVELVGGLLELLASLLEVGLGYHPVGLLERLHRRGERPPALGVVGVADPITGESGVVAAGVGDGVFEFLDPRKAAHVVGTPRVRDLPVVVDDGDGPFQQLLADVVLDGDVVLRRHRPVGVGQQRHLEVVLLGERPVAVDGVGADTQNRHVLLHRKEVQFVQVTGFGVTGGVEIGGVEREDDHVVTDIFV